MDGRRSSLSNYPTALPHSRSFISKLRIVCSSLPTRIELWSSSQHRVKLGKYKRDMDSIQREGDNLWAIWSPNTKLIAVHTSSFYLHIFKVQMTEKRKKIVGGVREATYWFISHKHILSSQRASSICK